MKDGREYTLKHEARARAKHKKAALQNVKGEAKRLSVINKARTKNGWKPITSGTYSYLNKKTFG